MIKDGILKPDSIGMQHLNEEEWADDRAQHEAACVLNVAARDTMYVDDLTKQPLREDLVKEAIKKYLDYFKNNKRRYGILYPVTRPEKSPGSHR